jgi:hypothetical protein
VIELARVSAQSSVAPQYFFDRWCDLDTHPVWAVGMEFLRLDEPFGIGARGTLKVRDGRESPFVVTTVVPGRAYADATILDGATMTVHHEATPLGEGSNLELHCYVEGERAQHWADEFAGIGDALAADLAALVKLAESEAA